MSKDAVGKRCGWDTFESFAVDLVAPLLRQEVRDVLAARDVCQVIVYPLLVSCWAYVYLVFVLMSRCLPSPLLWLFFLLLLSYQQTLRLPHRLLPWLWHLERGHLLLLVMALVNHAVCNGPSLHLALHLIKELLVTGVLPFSLGVQALDHILNDEVGQFRISAQIREPELVVLTAKDLRGSDDQADSAALGDLADD